jgi:hypothetical protein
LLAQLKGSQIPEAKAQRKAIIDLLEVISIKKQTEFDPEIH